MPVENRHVHSAMRCDTGRSRTIERRIYDPSGERWSHAAQYKNALMQRGASVMSSFSLFAFDFMRMRSIKGDTFWSMASMHQSWHPSVSSTRSTRQRNQCK